jgi:hypothetical protein
MRTRTERKVIDGLQFIILDTVNIYT